MSKNKRDEEIDRLRGRFGQMGIGGGGAGPSQQFGGSSSSSDTSDHELDDYIQKMRADDEFEEGDVSDSEELFGRGIERLRGQTDSRAQQTQRQKEGLMFDLFKKGFHVSNKRIVPKGGPQTGQWRGRPHLYPQGRRRLPQIRRDMRQRRQHWRSTAGKHYYGSPGVRRSRQLVDRSKHILSQRDRQLDPQMRRRLHYKKKLKNEWRPYRERQTSYRSPFKIREMEHDRVRNYMDKRRQTAIAGQSFADPSEPALKPSVPILSLDFDSIPEEDESGDKEANRYSHQTLGWNPMESSSESDSSDDDFDDESRQLM